MASPILSFIFLLIWNLCFSHEIVVSIIVQAKFCTNPVVHACKRIVVCFIRRRKDFHVRNKDIIVPFVLKLLHKLPLLDVRGMKPQQTLRPISIQNRFLQFFVFFRTGVKIELQLCRRSAFHLLRASLWQEPEHDPARHSHQ